MDTITVRPTYTSEAVRLTEQNLVEIAAALHEVEETKHSLIIYHVQGPKTGQPKGILLIDEQGSLRIQFGNWLVFEEGEGSPLVIPDEAFTRMYERVPWEEH